MSERPNRPGRPARPGLIGRRGAVVLTVLLAGALAWTLLDASLADLAPHEGGLVIARNFFAAAFAPALDYQSSGLPENMPPFLWQVLVACLRTLIFAAGAMSLALLAGLPLGFLASGSFWSGDPAAGEASAGRMLGHTIQWATRLLIALMRSIHELLWAVIFLAAFGLNTASAVTAIAIPFAGTLAKVFSEMLDEAPRNSAFALHAAGVPPLRVFLFGLLPRAAPDMAAYAFYRFECAVRSSAILGFFGYGTLGYFLRTSFENLHYREVWTYLYALLLLVIALEAWSGALRRRIVA
jgi:phosphonate transport system permease protein